MWLNTQNNVKRTTPIRRWLSRTAAVIFTARTQGLVVVDLLRLWARLRCAGRRNLIPEKPLLHLGCGKRHVDGWLNVDVTGSDFDLDLASGRLPWRDEVFDAVVSQHFIEHIEMEEQLIPLLHEIRRVLKPGGEVWLSCPDMEFLCRVYVEGRIADLLQDRRMRFPDYPFSAMGDPDLPPQHVVNHLFHQLGQHKNLYDCDLLAWALGKAGFSQIERVVEADLLQRFPRFSPRNDDSYSLLVRARSSTSFNSARIPNSRESI
jgi:predicted SAM-dependent methyltransferase